MRYWRSLSIFRVISQFHEVHQFWTLPLCFSNSIMGNHPSNFFLFDCPTTTSLVTLFVCAGVLLVFLRASGFSFFPLSRIWCVPFCVSLLFLPICACVCLMWSGRQLFPLSFCFFYFGIEFFRRWLQSFSLSPFTECTSGLSITALRSLYEFFDPFWTIIKGPLWILCNFLLKPTVRLMSCRETQSPISNFGSTLPRS